MFQNWSVILNLNYRDNLPLKNNVTPIYPYHRLKSIKKYILYEIPIVIQVENNKKKI